MAGVQRVLCAMYSRDSRYSEYAAEYARVSQGILTWFLINLEL